MKTEFSGIMETISLDNEIFENEEGVLIKLVHVKHRLVSSVWDTDLGGAYGQN